MSRLLAAATAVVLFVSIAGSVPKPKTPPPSPDFFPCRLGTTWVFEQDGVETTRTVAAVESRDGETRVALTVRGQSEWAEHFTVTPAGVFRTRLDRYEIDPPLCMFKPTAKVGEVWDAAEPVLTGLLAHGGRMKVGEPELVTVPAGTFRAVPVYWEVKTWDGEPLEEPETYTYWYAADVGLVQFQAGSVLRRLKSFTPGPVAPAGK
jgi:hypothetical protein